MYKKKDRGPKKLNPKGKGPKKLLPQKKTVWGSRRQFGPVLRVPKRVIIGTKGVHIKDPVVKLVK